VNIIQATRGSTPSYIELFDLQVRTVRGVPYGTYELVVRGTSVLNNENFSRGTTPTGQTTPGGFFNVNAGPGPYQFLNPWQENYRRYGMMPYMILNYINVVTPGHGQPGAPGTQPAFNWDEVPTVVIPHAPGGSFTVDGVAFEFGGGLQSVNLPAPAVINTVAVPANRLFVPFRAVIEALAGFEGPADHPDNPIQFFAGNLYMGIPHTVITTIGDRTVTFRVGETYFVRSGETGNIQVPMVIQNDVISPFIGDGTNGTNPGTMYLPVRFIANAFGLALDDNVAGTVVIN
jgi:hypothetical protein